MTDRRWLAALGLSLLIHLTVVGSPGWHLPSFDVPEANNLIEAHLAPKPAAPPAPVLAPALPLPKAQPKPQPQPRRPQPAPQTEPAPPPAEAAPPPEAPSAAAAPPPAPAQAPVDIPWPRQGRIRFLITRGGNEQGMLIGQSVHTWKHDGTNYALQTVSETTGLVALFRQARVVQASEGRVGAEGIVPQEFRVERNGQAGERARFDWEGRKVTFHAGSRKEREMALAAGTQDVLSQIYQIGMLGTAARVELMIATGKNYGRYAYEAVGDEKLATRFGELRTWHVKTPALPGEQAMELWLALDYRNLPVRIRYMDRKGEVFDQNAVEFEIDGAALAARKE